MSRHFIFDLGNVLVDFDVHRLYRAVADISGRSVEEIAPGLLDGDMVHAVESGKITDQQFLDYVNQAKGIHWTLEDLIRVWQGMFSINAAGCALFTELRERGYPVHFLSNLAWHNMEAIRRNWPDFFERSVENFFSYELGLRKPDERIYRAALRRLGAEPGDCFFLDDRPENVDGARAAGIHALQFIPENYAAIRKAVDEFSG